MNSPARRPKVPLGGLKSNNPGEVRPAEMVGRLLFAAVTIVSPITAVVAGVLAFIVTRERIMRRVSWWWIFAPSLVLFLGAFLGGAGRSFTRPWVELFTTATRMTRGVIPWGNVATLAAAQWPNWMLGQLLLGLPIAGMYAAAVMWWRHRWGAVHRDDYKTTGPEHLQGHAAERALRRALEGNTPLADGEDWKASQVLLGLTPTGAPAWLTAEMLRAHVLLTGPTGRGKTQTLLRLAEGILVTWASARLPFVLFDFKGDPEVRDGAHAMAQATNRNFYLVTLGKNTTTWNPLRHGTPEELASRLMAALTAGNESGEVAYYRKSGEVWLNIVCRALDNLIENGTQHPSGRPWSRDLHDLAELMNPDILKTHSVMLSGRAGQLAVRKLADMETDFKFRQAVGGMITAVELLTITGAGDILREDPNGVDLEQAVKAGDVVCFSIATETDPTAASVIGNLAITAMSALFGQLQEERWAKRTNRQCFVLLDEFSGMGGSALEPFLARARSAGGTAIVSSQTEADFVKVSPTFAENVYSNNNVQIYHAQPGQAASRRAEDIGTETALSETWQIAEDADALGTTVMASGVGSLREVQRFVVHPDELRRLQPGEVVVVTQTPQTVQRVKIAMPDPWDARLDEDDARQELLARRPAPMPEINQITAAAPPAKSAYQAPPSPPPSVAAHAAKKTATAKKATTKRTPAKRSPAKKATPAATAAPTGFSDAVPPASRTAAAKKAASKTVIAGTEPADTPTEPID